MPKMTPTFPYRDYESKNMNIVQIGCNDCHIDDPVQSYILENHKDIKKLILVDANKRKMMKGCKSLYEQFDFDLVLIPKAITAENNNELTIYMSLTDLNGQHTSVNKNHLLRHDHREENIHKFVLPAININKLFEENNLTKIDRLYIDTEGYDIEIIKSIDFERWDISFIYFEVAHSKHAHSGDKNKICHDLYRWLDKKNYKVFSDGGNAKAVRK